MRIIKGCAALIATVSLCGMLATPSFARPPTVMQSPGYDARLAESRKALQAQQQWWPSAPAPVQKPKRKKTR